MNFSNIMVVIDRGKDEIRVGRIKDQLASGILKFDPDSDLTPPPPKVSKARVSIAERLEIALGFAEFKGTLREYAETTTRSYSFVLTCKNEYLAGHLGDVDSAIARKLKGNKAKGVIEERLKIVLALAEFKGTVRDFSEISDRGYSFIYIAKKEYLAGHLGEVDKVIVEKLKRGKTNGPSHKKNISLVYPR